ncbi:MAG: hypothetical protein H3C34_07060 [Caldilineaceae bacterium]|nr:hypothetical protein [Caldilineaceae bacterium]
MSALTQLEGIEIFNSLRAKANFQVWWGRLVRRCVHLCSLEELLGNQHAYGRRDIGIRTVPLSQIVASIGRQHDFTNSFLPLAGVSEQRWVGLYLALQGFAGFPEVELLKVGDKYAVMDGHHRISVMRAAGIEAFPAHVIEVIAPPTQASTACPPACCHQIPQDICHFPRPTSRPMLG